MSSWAFILLLLLSMTSIHISVTTSWLCWKCGWRLKTCSNDNCLAQAKQNFHFGTVTLDSTVKNVVFKCQSGFDLEGYSVIACNVCEMTLLQAPPICKKRTETRVEIIHHVKEPPVIKPVVTTTSTVLSTRITTMANLPIQAKHKTSTNNDTFLIWGSAFGAFLLLVAIVAAGVYVYKKRRQQSSNDIDLYAYPNIVCEQQNDVPPPVPEKPPPRREFAESETTAQNYLDVMAADADATPEYSYITEEDHKPTQNVMFIGDRGWKVVNGR